MIKTSESSVDRNKDTLVCTCHSFLNCAFYLDKSFIFLCKQKRNIAFRGLPCTFYSTISTKSLVVVDWYRPVLQSFSLPTIHGSSPTRAMKTIFLFIMRGCVSMYEILRILTPLWPLKTSKMCKESNKQLLYSSNNLQIDNSCQLQRTCIYLDKLPDILPYRFHDYNT